MQEPEAKVEDETTEGAPVTEGVPGQEAPPEERPPEEKPPEAAGEPEPLTLTDEQIAALLGGGESAEEKPPAAEPPPIPAPVPPAAAPAPEREPAPRPPAPLVGVGPQSLMPEGQTFDPYEAYTPGTASFEARERAEQERIRTIVSETVKQSEQERFRADAQRNYEAFVRSHPDMRDEGKRREYEHFLATTAIDGSIMDLEELYNAMRFTKAMRSRKRPGAVPRGGREVPPPVTSAPRSAEPKPPEEVRQEADKLLGPER